MPPLNPDKTILVLHGPNLNMLGQREPEIYGTDTLDDINKLLKSIADRHDYDCVAMQSNHEGELITQIQQFAQKSVGLIINPAGYTHTSVAIRDALVLYSAPVVEVHMSNIFNRESFRSESMMSSVVTGVISGFGADSYRLAMLWLIHHLDDDDA